MAENYLTGLSAGIDLRTILLDDATLAAELTAVFPVVIEEARLPYVTYRLAALSVENAKSEYAHDHATYVLSVYAADYDTAARLAERVRRALWRRACGTVGSAYLQGAQGAWMGDAYCFDLTYSVAVNPMPDSKF